MQEHLPPTTHIQVSRLIHASPASIYDAWLDPAQPGGPWHGCPTVQINPVVGGLFYHCVHYLGHDWAHYGRFVLLERPQRLQHTWVSESTRGLESLLDVQFQAQGDSTLVTLTQTNVPDDVLGRQHEQGWSYVLDALQARFAKPGT